MKLDTKKRIFSVFVLVMFVGSSVAIALMSSYEPEQKEQTRLIYDKPLTNAEEVPFLQENFVVLKYFYSEECESCDIAMVEQLVQDLGGKIIIEEIDTVLYPEEASDYFVSSVPYYYFKGRTIKKVSGNMSSDEMFTTACDLYFEPIDQCMLT